MNYLMLLCILLPVLAGVLMPAFPCLKREGCRRIYLVAVLILNLLMALAICLTPHLRLQLLSLTPKMPILLKSDGLSRFFALLVGSMFLLAGIYSLEYMKDDPHRERFYVFYLVVLGTLNGIAYAGNLITLYLFFEGMTLLSVPLVLHNLTKEAVAAAFKYLFYSIAGASLALIGIFYIYIDSNNLEFTAGGALDASAVAGQETTLLVVSLLAVIGFAAKAGMFPLHAWLPDAHPVAPAPASAILSGVITKAGVVAIIRFVYFTVGPDLLRGTWMQYAWISLALLTVVMGSMLAYQEPLLKKRLAYSSVSQVSYILFGLATLTVGGVVGALLHMMFHSIIKDALFMVAGAIPSPTEPVAVSQLRGIGRKMPVTLGCFALVSIALVGIPPTGGFLSKWHLSMGSLSSQSGVFDWLGPAVLLFSALLTAGYLFPIAIRGFFPGSEGEDSALEQREPGILMLAPMVILAAASLVLGVFPEQWMAALNHLAEQMA